MPIAQLSLPHEITMRRIGTLETQQYAERFADFLSTRGVSTQIEESKGRWSVWVRDEDLLDQSREDLDRFVQSPDADEYLNAVSEAQKLRAEEKRRQQKVANNRVNVREGWQAPFVQRAPLTAALIGICIVVGILSDSVFAPNNTAKFKSNPIYRGLSLYDPIEKRDSIGDPFQVRVESKQDGGAFTDIKRGQVWRLFTPAFLHRGFGHILFNLFVLHFLGGRIETRQRWPRILILFLAGSSAGVLAEHFFSNANAVGFSGVGYSLFGYLWVYGMLAPAERLGVEPQNAMIFLGWLVAGFAGILEAVFGMAVANWAHLGGLVAGALVAVVAVWFDREWKKRKKKPVAAT